MAASTSNELSTQLESATTNDTPKLDEKEMEELVGKLESVRTEEELDNKLSTMSKLGFSLANWMKLVFNRDTSEKEFKAVWLTIDEYKSQADESMHTAWRILNTSGWKLEKRGTYRGDIVESRHVDQLGKVYRFTGMVDCPAKFLYEEFKNNLTRLPEWNPTILKSEFIKEIGPGYDLSYQVTAGGGRGIIAPRDFVLLRRTAQLSSEGRAIEGDEPHCYITSGISVAVPGYPPRKDMVRGNNKVGCWFLKPSVTHTPAGHIQHRTLFQWLMCCDLKGKIPQFVLDTAFSTVMLDYIVHVRKFVLEAKNKGMF